MAIADRQKSGSDLKRFSLCPFWQTGTNSSSSSSTQNLNNHGSNRHVDAPNSRQAKTVSSVARSLLPPRRRLRLDPANTLYFPYETGKQVRSAIRLKNTSRSHVAFKFQTTAPKSCYMRPPGGILSPGESIIATVFKFVEQPENNEKLPLDQKIKDKFKIMSLKVKGGIDYVPELIRATPYSRTLKHEVVVKGSVSSMFLFSYNPTSLKYSWNLVFEEQREQVTVERILRVVFLDIQRPSSALEKLKLQLDEAEAAVEARKKPPPDTGPRVVGEGFVIDEWISITNTAPNGAVNMELVKSGILNEEMRRRSQTSSSSSQPDVLVTDSRGRSQSREQKPRGKSRGKSNRYANIECHHCKKKGHIKKFCRKFKNEQDVPSTNGDSTDLELVPPTPVPRQVRDEGQVDEPDEDDAPIEVGSEDGEYDFRKMGNRNKACIMVTLGAAFGNRDHMIKSNSCALKPEWTAMVSSMLQAKLFSGDFRGSQKLLSTGNEERTRAEDSLKMVIYLSFWDPIES
ncbi:hypothetical protein JRO89_XS15G0132500 [Xanthoceras sorbifolium]|uniref:MSP domain-containing protein n=1 Tax=Xanthoceras sorbifolium TaxID=99658 RepID=A0ABQ8H1Z1_9ROSI|nr:hypothetical protein JRO89_XS15G0132500 [Xanthoceras sorbifolium]